MKKWSSQWTQFMQLRKKAWKKLRTSTGFEPVTWRFYRCDALPTELWSHWHWEQVNKLWVHMFLWKKWVLIIYEINHIWKCGNEMKMKKWLSQWTQFINCVKKPEKNSGLQTFFFQASLRNCINCIHCNNHFFIFISFPQFMYDLFHISLKK